MYCFTGTSYKVKVLDDNGKAAAGVKVRFALNGKSLYRTTDKNGYASIKITLAPKTYTIYAVYKGFKVTNKIVVKPTIITKDITQKRSNPVKFYAKLLDSSGNILKNKRITFTVGSKTYYATTNAQGTAVLSIYNLNIGKYTIISKYSAASRARSRCRPKFSIRTASISARPSLPCRKAAWAALLMVQRSCLSISRIRGSLL